MAAASESFGRRNVLPLLASPHNWFSVDEAPVHAEALLSDQHASRMTTYESNDGACAHESHNGSQWQSHGCCNLESSGRSLGVSNVENKVTNPNRKSIMPVFRSLERTVILSVKVWDYPRSLGFETAAEMLKDCTLGSLQNSERLNLGSDCSVVEAPFAISGCIHLLVQIQPGHEYDGPRTVHVELPYLDLQNADAAKRSLGAAICGQIGLSLAGPATFTICPIPVALDMENSLTEGSSLLTLLLRAQPHCVAALAALSEVRVLLVSPTGSVLLDRIAPLCPSLCADAAAADADGSSSPPGPLLITRLVSVDMARVPLPLGAAGLWVYVMPVLHKPGGGAFGANGLGGGGLGANGLGGGGAAVIRGAGHCTGVMTAPVLGCAPLLLLPRDAAWELRRHFEDVVVHKRSGAHGLGQQAADLRVQCDAYIAHFRPLAVLMGRCLNLNAPSGDTEDGGAGADDALEPPTGAVLDQVAEIVRVLVGNGMWEAGALLVRALAVAGTHMVGLSGSAARHLTAAQLSAMFHHSHGMLCDRHTAPGARTSAVHTRGPNCPACPPSASALRQVASQLAGGGWRWELLWGYGVMALERQFQDTHARVAAKQDLLSLTVLMMGWAVSWCTRGGTWGTVMQSCSRNMPMCILLPVLLFLCGLWRGEYVRWRASLLIACHIMSSCAVACAAMLGRLDQLKGPTNLLLAVLGPLSFPLPFHSALRAKVPLAALLLLAARSLVAGPTRQALLTGALSSGVGVLLSLPMDMWVRRVVANQALAEQGLAPLKRVVVCGPDTSGWTGLWHSWRLGHWFPW